MICKIWGIFKRKGMRYDGISAKENETMKRKVFGLLCVLFLLSGCGRNTENIVGEENAAEENQTEEIQEEAPYVLTFEASDIAGEAVTSECFAQSKLTMINVWATYCGPCLNEMPALAEISDAYDTAEFQLIGIISDVAEDAEAEQLAEAKELIAQTGADYTHLLLNESLYRNLLSSVSAVPTTFFVNQKGELLGYVMGAYEKEDWEAIINELLAQVE